MSRSASLRVVAAPILFGLTLGSMAQTGPPVTTTLTVAGNVAQPLTLTVEDLKRYPVHRVEYAPGDNRTHDTRTEGPRRYTGCLLRDVLAAAKPTENQPRGLRRSYVVAGASDGYEVVFSWAELFVSLFGDSVLVVYERDGAPLPDDEGRIALIAASDARPVRHVKWLRTLRLEMASTRAVGQ